MLSCGRNYTTLCEGRICLVGLLPKLVRKGRVQMNNGVTTRVRCFRTEYPAEDGEKRYGLWLMEPDDNKGIFIHGHRNECQSPRYTLSELDSWAKTPCIAFKRVLEISPRRALTELDSFPFAQEAAAKMFKLFQ